MNHNKLRITPALHAAVKAAKNILFQPFDLEKWLVIGFAAWLADFGRGPGLSIWHKPGNARGTIQWQQLQDWIQSNFVLFIGIAAVAAIFILAITVLLIWLSSRARFVFLYCITQNRHEIVKPWHQFAHLGNSLFLFRLALAAAVLIAGIILSIAAALLHFAAGRFVFIAAVGTFLLIASVSFALITVFTRDFVLPLMYIRNITILPAWRIFLPVLSEHLWQFVLYLLTKLALMMAFVWIVSLAVIFTCCLALCFFDVPYVGTVVLLPFYVFIRAFSLKFLAQLGTDFNAFAHNEIANTG